MTGPPNDRNRARTLAARAEQLPLLPSVLLRVLALDPGGDDYFDGILGIAEQDPSFAARVIRLANAPMSAPAKPIVSVRQAVVRLGARECATLATALAVARVFVPVTQGQRNLWVHALQVAVAARTIASLTATLRFAPDQAYLAGLLHDIGRFVMFEGAPEDLGRVDETHWTTPQQLLDTEFQLLGYDHVQLGAMVCARWMLPDAIAELVQLHHVYSLPDPQRTMAIGNLIRIVQMADLLSVLMMSEPAVVEQPLVMLVPTLAARCVHPAWPLAPVPPAVLAPHVRAIRDEADALAEHLLELRVTATH